MKKIEVIHDTSFTQILKKLKVDNVIKGFTTLAIHNSSGPLNGFFIGDHLTDEQYYTFILIDGGTKDLIDKINALYNGRKLLILESEVTSYESGKEDL